VVVVVVVVVVLVVVVVVVGGISSGSGGSNSLHIFLSEITLNQNLTTKLFSQLKNFNDKSLY